MENCTEFLFLMGFTGMKTVSANTIRNSGLYKFHDVGPPLVENKDLIYQQIED